MRKRLINSFLMILMLALISGFLSFIAASNDFASSEDMYYNYFLSEHAKKIALNVTGTDIKPGATIISPDFSTLGDNFSLYRIVTLVKNKDSESVRAVYSRGNSYVPPLLSGRWFTQEELEGDRQLAVVGRIIYDRLVPDENGRRVFTYLGVDYETVGCIGTSYESNVNNLAMIPLYSYLKTYTGDGLYYIDAKTEQNARAVTDAFFTHMALDPVYSAIFTPVYIVPENTSVFHSSATGLIFIYSAILIILNTVLICARYTEELRYPMAVRKLLGVSAVRAVGEQLLRFLGIDTAGYILGVLFVMPTIYAVLDRINGDIYLQISYGNIIISYLLTALLFFLIVIPFTVKLYMTDTSAELKGKE